jgi:hypothetical protein
MTLAIYSTLLRQVDASERLAARAAAMKKAPRSKAGTGKAQFGWDHQKRDLLGMVAFTQV